MLRGSAMTTTMIIIMTSAWNRKRVANKLLDAVKMVPEAAPATDSLIRSAPEICSGTTDCLLPPHPTTLPSLHTSPTPV
jgi:hypothetical protein